MGGRLAFLACASMVGLLGPTTAFAQARGSAMALDRSVARAGRPTAMHGTDRHDTTGATVRPPVVGTVRLATSGADVIVARVRVPDDLPASADRVATWRYQVQTASYAQMLGATAGAVRSAETVLVPLRISRRAPAGRTVAATVTFVQTNEAVAVNVEVEIPVVRSLTVSPGTPAVAVRGAWSVLPIRLDNGGNVAEHVAVRVAPPSGWRASWRPPPGDSVPARSRAVADLRVWIPEHAPLGLSFVTVQVGRSDSTWHTEQVPVDILARPESQSDGPTVRSAVAAAAGADRQVVLGYALDLSGQVSDSTRVAGRFTFAGRTPELAGTGFALARSGVITAPPMVELVHPSREVRLGAVGGTLPELGGQFLSGIGAAGRVRRGAWDVQAHRLSPPALAQPFTLLPRTPGHYSGVEVGYRTGRVRTALFGSDLQDPLTQRALSAVGVRASVGPHATADRFISASGSMLQGELARRDHGAGATLGLAGSYRYVGSGTTVEARALHAPGGSRSFARATNEYAFSASRTIARRHGIAAGVWWQDDANALLGASSTRGWFFTPTAAFGRAGTVMFEARGSRFGASAGTNRLVNDEVSGGGSYFFDLHGVQVLTRSLLSSVQRELLDPAAATVRNRELRLEHQVMLSRTIMGGTAQAMWQHQQASGVGGLLPPQQSLQFRMERLRPFATVPVEVSAEYQRLHVSGGVAPLWTARGAVTIPLLAGMAVTVGVERNPFAGTGPDGRGAARLYSLRVDRTTRLPRPFRGAASQAFRDDNGNGVRDGRERGVAGVLVRCGSQRVLTEGDGRFRCPTSRSTVDARSVPAGLVATKTQLGPGESLPLRVLQPVRITLRMTPADSNRLPVQALERAVVTALDSAGGQWLARSAGGGAFVVDALPAGTYTIAVDAGDLDEPVVPVGIAPRVRVGGDHDASAVDVLLRARPLRLRTFDGTAALPLAPNAAPATARPSTSRPHQP